MGRCIVSRTCGHKYVEKKNISVRIKIYAIIFGNEVVRHMKVIRENALTEVEAKVKVNNTPSHLLIKSKFFSCTINPS